MTLAAAIYTRISDDPELTRLGVQRQEEDCRELVDRRGWSVAGVYEDDDISAYSGKLRPAYRRLLEDIGAGAVQAIVAWHPDRLHRHPRELEEFITLVETAGIRIETVRAGTIDFSTPTGRMVARMLGATARYVSEHKADRIRRKHLELAATGKDAGGGRPFGYKANRIELEPAEAELVREAARRVLEGEALRAICRDWNSRHIATPRATGRGWSAQVLRRLLISARISGRREHGHDAGGKRLDLGRITCEKAEWPAIISVDDSDRLRHLLAGPNRIRRPQVREYLLTGGIARCGRCGEALQAHPRADGRKEMACVKRPGTRGCGRLGVLAGPVEDLVSEAILQAADAGALAKALERGDDDREALDELLRIKAKQEDLADMWRADEITRAGWQRASQGLREREQQLQRLVDRGRQSRSLDGIPDQLRAAWPAMQLHRRRAAVELLIEAVVVKPAAQLGRYDPDRVEVRWRV